MNTIDEGAILNGNIRYSEIDNHQYSGKLFVHF